jgi:signal transduction protein with GAF and PtsI domain
VEDAGDRFHDVHSKVDLILAEGGHFDAAAPKVLRTLCEGLGWNVGIAWRFDESDRVLRFVASWHHPSSPMTQLEKLSERSTLSPGVGLPGRILAGGEPTCITDVQRDRGFPRSPAAMEDGIHGAVGFPLIRDWKVVGVIELFSKEAKEPDEELLISVAQLGLQLGGLLAGEGEE